MEDVILKMCEESEEVTSQEDGEVTHEVDSRDNAVHIVKSNPFSVYFIPSHLRSVYVCVQLPCVWSGMSMWSVRSWTV